MKIAFVSAPTGNAFMAEILAATAEAARQAGAETLVHRGTVDEVDDGSTAFVVVPHEYFWFNPRPAAERLRRTISFGVEHPGTDTFEVAARAASVMAARFEISTDSVKALAVKGLPAEHFALGYSRHWDHWGGVAHDRPIDLAYMGAADPERLQVLAGLAPQLTGLQAELLIPPIEQRLKPRPDFLMGAAKWELLAGTKVLLNLHRQDKTALELVRTLEAMCNGCVLLTEPSTDLAGFEPGTHLLVAPREQIGLRAEEAVDDPRLLSSVAAAAYEFCKRELRMSASAQRLVAVADDLVRQARAGSAPLQVVMPDWPEVRPPHVPELAFWIPEPYPLPPVGATLVPEVRQTVRNLAVSRRQRMAIDEIYTAGSETAEIDVIIVLSAASGPLAQTIASLTTQTVPTKLHVAGLGIPKPDDLTGIETYLTCTAETSVGAARNELIERSNAAHLLMLDGGDELLGDFLPVMVARLRGSPEIRLSYPMAAFGTQTLVNLFQPEPDRLERFGYLTRGYLAERAWIAELGSFAEDPVMDAYVDHDFWLRAAAHPDAIAHIHRIGIRLWPTELTRMMPTDPAEVRAMFELRATGVL